MFFSNRIKKQLQFIIVYQRELLDLGNQYYNGKACIQQVIIIYSFVRNVSFYVI